MTNERKDESCKLKSWLSPKVKKSPSKIHGIGIFASDDISKDEIIAVKAGRLLNLAQMKALSFKGLSDLQIADDLFVCPATPEERNESMIGINHSCEPNVGMRGDVVFVAMRDIKAEEELDMDYAMIGSSCIEKGENAEMTCLCGTQNCRKAVRGDDYKLAKIMDYGQYLSSYIQSKLGLR